MACNLRVRLNVGGKRFIVDHDTIKKSTVLYEKYAKKRNVDILSDFDDDEDDELLGPLDIFIDRDGELFKGILEYWRSQNVPSDDPEYLNKLKLEASHFRVHDLVSKVDKILLDYEIMDDDYEYQVIQHPFKCNYLIKPSDGELKPFEEDAAIVSAYKYCPSQNVFESKLVLKRPRKRCRLDKI
ncbi:hypothetical protein [Parasitella parasitica]|uniref:Potassium channel tetramerisation-type BTB domain-containing protein n=1 Tax=Parasitella parasitica TaxID=35722 RepID=A0A0B7MTV7_9FUNG|nr:hypothetical protein [Parasitella parasitica]